MMIDRWPSIRDLRARGVRNFLMLAFAALGLGCSLAGFAAQPGVTVRSVKGTFDDLRERVVHAIENEGLVLNYTAHIGDMLERTGRDLGATGKLYEKAQLFEFCSAKLSRDAMAADPHAIAYCPYAIAVYTLPRAPGTVYVTFRDPPPVAGMRPVRELLQRIVNEAVR